MKNKLLADIDRDKITPMMRQYIDQKKNWEDCILFFRLGDFYEMFFDDALIASRELELALTGRDCGLEKRAPMCGVPYHASDSYILKLVGRGYKVAICEQVEDVSQAKGIVKRKVIKVVTPGTVTDTNGLDEKTNNYIAVVYKVSCIYGLAFADITTGSLDATSIVTGNTASKLADEVIKKNPSEIICNEAMKDSPELKSILLKSSALVNFSDDEFFSEEKFKSYFPKRETENKLWIHAVAALMEYVFKTQSSIPSHLRNINEYTVEEYMHIDRTAGMNLEIAGTIREKSKKGSLLWVLDKTDTAMGGRLLKRWLEQPLINKSDILYRLDAVEEIKEKFLTRQEIKEILTGINDIERLAGKISLNTVNARDLDTLKKSLGKLPNLKDTLKEFNSGMWKDLYHRFDILEDIRQLIDKAIVSDPPLSIKEGDIINPEYNPQVKKLKEASKNGKKWIVDYEAEERRKTGIKNLKVKYTNNFGFLIEVSNSNKENTPDYFIRRQTLVNCERYITDELKKMEETILGAQQKLMGLEYDIFCEIREQINDASQRLFKASVILSTIDVISSFGEVADRNKYNRPVIDNSDIIEIKDGRHPVVEKVLKEGEFVPNSAKMDENENRIILITGPNMGGKSTYMRQIAQTVILAQTGCFVPAENAHIGIVDKIFTRIGASDDLSSGQSTFMTEMNEVSYILKNATEKSLLILDEVGRGTSTYDGLSIAWAVIEYIASKSKIGCKTLFATHYHELIQLEENIEGMKNYHVKASEHDGDIVFLHKVDRGGCDDSYGIDVAKLAGVPVEVIRRAKEILSVLEKDKTKDQLLIKKKLKVMEGQLDIFTSALTMKRADTIIDELKTLDVQKMTPLDAMNLLYEISNKAKKIDINNGSEKTE